MLMYSNIIIIVHVYISRVLDSFVCCMTVLYYIIILSMIVLTSGGVCYNGSLCTKRTHEV